MKLMRMVCKEISEQEYSPDSNSVNNVSVNMDTEATNINLWHSDCFHRVILVTACSSKKADKPSPAMYLYLSTRIKQTREIAREFNIPLYILSAKYGLICGHTVIEPYETVMTEKQMMLKLPETINKLRILKDRGLETVVYYRAGARKSYESLLYLAAKYTDVEFVSVGFGNLGGLQELRQKLAEILNDVS